MLSCSRSSFLPFRHKDRERAKAAQCPQGVVAKRRERSEWNLQKAIGGNVADGARYDRLPDRKENLGEQLAGGVPSSK
ncbi:hypothetical protein GCM10009617_36140 [Leifsonia poae]|uniref:Uncharacterized protein n=1 Tax=Leifsonia poae TaxID=110933 RepID=A0A9W6H9R5_9MICO|nr:hypothetical protein GCM10017584_20930 [Leifsonia poae]